MDVERHIEHRGGAIGDARARGRELGQAVSELASRQHGVVARRQLLRLGLTARVVGRHVEHGRLQPLHAVVYAVGHRALSPRGRWMAAALAGGEGAVLSHRSAAALWGIAPAGSRGIDITSPTHRRSTPALIVHRSRLASDERDVVDAIPVTSVARTLIDLASVRPAAAIERALHEAELLRLGGGASLDTLLDRHRGRRGIASLRVILERSRLGQDVTRGRLEEDFAAMIRRARLPRPIANAIVEGFEVDATWPDARLIVEVDGHAVHVTRRAFEADRLRDRRLTLAGWRVVRVTWRQLHDAPAEVAGDLRRLLRASHRAPPGCDR